MKINPQAAINAYRQTAFSQTIGPDNIAGKQELSQVGLEQGNFADLMKSLANEAITQNRYAEQTSQRAIAGEASLSEVVEAIANAEATLRTVTTIRDRVVSAYQEILRTPI